MLPEKNIIVFASNYAKYDMMKDVFSKNLELNTFLIPCRTPFLISELLHRYKAQSIISYPKSIVEVEILIEFFNKYNTKLICFYDWENQNLSMKYQDKIKWLRTDYMSNKILEELPVTQNITIPTTKVRSIKKSKNKIGTILSNYIVDMNKAENSNIMYDIKVIGERKLFHDLHKKICNIIYELIQNSFKHSGCSFINIKLYCENDFISVSYFDNGIGIPPRRKKKTGNGLDMIREMIREHSGKIKITAPLNNGFSCKIILTNNTTIDLTDAA